MHATIAKSTGMISITGNVTWHENNINIPVMKAIFIIPMYWSHTYCPSGVAAMEHVRGLIILSIQMISTYNMVYVLHFHHIITTLILMSAYMQLEMSDLCTQTTKMIQTKRKSTYYRIQHIRSILETDLYIFRSGQTQIKLRV